MSNYVITTSRIPGNLESRPSSDLQYYEGLLVTIEPPVVLDQHVVDEVVVAKSLEGNILAERDRVFEAAVLLGELGSATTLYLRLAGEWRSQPEIIIDDRREPRPVIAEAEEYTLAIMEKLLLSEHTPVDGEKRPLDATVVPLFPRT